jgi:thiamine-monophosphate kinase
MALSEFTLINQYFNKQVDAAFPAKLGIGDDCALIDVPPNMELAVSTDTLVERVHFLANSDPHLLGYKSLAVNLSDLSAMGAKPAWVSLALTLPEANEHWIKAFSKGFLLLAQSHSMQLIGGDTTQGPLSISVTVMGLLPKGKALKRSGASVGDGVYLSGNIGSAGLGLIKAQQMASDSSDEDLVQYLKPMPNIDLGEQLLTRASACIDVSDGLAADLSHILNASGVAARVFHKNVPMTEGVKQHIKQLDDELWPYSTGDDYQLCFTLPKALTKDKKIMGLVEKNIITHIGEIEAGKGLIVVMSDGSEKTINKGFQHFNKGPIETVHDK